MKRRVGERSGRQWRCLLCPEHGVAADEKASLDAFEAHYAEKHMERKGNA
jgi:hypothetical protein